MKHIKKFESLIEHSQQERTESMKNDIMDMALEIQDDGFQVEVSDDPDTYYKGFGYSPDFIIKISKHNEQFYIDEIKDFLLRMGRYCEALHSGKSHLFWFLNFPNASGRNFEIDREDILWQEIPSLKRLEMSVSPKHKIKQLFIKVRVFR